MNENGQTPLESWTCDVCGDLIRKEDTGFVVWRLIGEPAKAGDFKVIHQERCDPGGRNGYHLSAPLDAFLGDDGLTYLLAMLSPGPFIGPQEAMPRIADFDELVDFVRRVQTPWYEEARRSFSDPDVRYDHHDGNEYGPYTVASLRGIAQRQQERDATKHRST